MSEKHSGIAVEEREVSLEAMDRLHDLNAVSSEERFDLAEAQGTEKLKLDPQRNVRRVSSQVLRLDGGPTSGERSANLCPHGGKIVNEVAYCGICANVGNDVAQFELFLFSLYDLCSVVAKHVWSPSVSQKDRQHHAFLAILTNIKTILGARNPQGMAHSIAKRSLINLTKLAVNKKEIPVSRLGSPGGEWGEGWEELSNSDRLEILAGVGDGDEEEPFAEPGRPSEFTYFPGVRSLWKPQYLRQLEISLEKAFGNLPTRPVSQSLAVKLWVGMLPECGKLNYEQIAKLLNLSERQARYQVQQGLSNLRRLLEEDAKQLVQRANERR
jgi:hypothetical protein